MSLYIEPEVYAGTPIEDAANAACALAARLGVDVWIQFNGVRVLAKPGTQPAAFVQAWKDVMDGKNAQGAFKSDQHSNRAQRLRDAGFTMPPKLPSDE